MSMTTKSIFKQGKFKQSGPVWTSENFNQVMVSLGPWRPIILWFNVDGITSLAPWRHSLAILFEISNTQLFTKEFSLVNAKVPCLTRRTLIVNKDNSQRSGRACTLES